MEHYITFKMIHMLTAYLTGLFLLVRLGLDAAGKPGWRSTPLRWIPHVNDTILLVMAISLVVIGGWNILGQHWLLLKILLLVGYIVAGVFAIKPKFATRTRIIAAILAFVQLLAIFHLAMAKPF
ncbi:invasion protein [Aliidiomarina halalkaliphila]|uniref:Invasion protein n=1 Tax=Aliidiomarina halalkaliphila TaxID=2593535 RepID=A0A552X1D9_9GAMM|nr:SirB2 family protein [Aliidiomarina halalkaliphila]TRW48861.1 invasion protein [Aliidiomarina halalkaliphila]